MGAGCSSQESPEEVERRRALDAEIARKWANFRAEENARERAEEESRKKALAAEEARRKAEVEKAEMLRKAAVAEDARKKAEALAAEEARRKAEAERAEMLRKATVAKRLQVRAILNKLLYHMYAYIPVHSLGALIFSPSVLQDEYSIDRYSGMHELVQS